MVAKSESPTTAMRDRGRRSATTISVFGPGTSRPLTKPTRSRLACPQLFRDEFTIGTTDVSGTRWGVGESERTPGKNVRGRSRVT